MPSLKNARYKCPDRVSRLSKLQPLILLLLACNDVSAPESLELLSLMAEIEQGHHAISGESQD